MLTLCLIASIVLSGNPGDMKEHRKGGIEFFGNTARSELNVVEMQFKRLQGAIEAGENAREAADAFRETVEAVKAIELQERLKAILADTDSLYADALEVRRKAAAELSGKLDALRKEIGVEGSTIYTSSTVIR